MSIDLPMTAQPQVAVLMCVHKGADAAQFEESLASMRAQTHRNLRLFVYCDGPLQAAHEEVIARLLHTEPGLDLVVRGEQPAGLPTGLNRLIDCALQDPSIAYIARMDADDISVPERIARQVAHLQSEPLVTVVGTWVVEFSVPGTPMFRKRLPTDPAEVGRFMLYRSPLAHPTVMFRRSVFERGHRYNANLLIMQDYDLWSRLLLAGEVISNVPDYLLWFRMPDDFYKRRSGLTRAWGEARMRFAYAWRTRKLRPTHLLGFAALFTIRIMPSAFKRLAYQWLR